MSGYQVIRILGTGAHSTIWEVRDQRTHQTYAMKRVIRNGRSETRFFRQAINEFHVASRIDHPNVRKVYSLRKMRRFLSVRELRLLMEFCEGRTVQENRPDTPVKACSIFAQVANALHRMNESGFVHADMKPNNIVVDTHGNVKIIDLGQSCPIGTIKPRIQGTPDFIAPEQVNRHPLDARTDVFNFGASLYWALTGSPIATALPSENALHTTSIVPPPGQRNRDVPEALSRLVMDCIQPHPSNRPRGLQDVCTRMGAILGRMVADD